MPPSSTVIASSLLETNRRFLAYWLGKLEGERMPRKARIDPTEMPRLLPDLVLYERLSTAHFKIRLAGTAVVRRLGVDPTGTNMLDLLAEASRQPVERALNRILDEPCAHVSRVRDRYLSGRQAVVEVLRLPLCDEAGEARFIISSTAETADEFVWADPQERPVLLAELVEQSFFGWSGGDGGELRVAGL
ncbi:PAS domain-containing protein [Tistlia consotensis]|uniref:PAS domain-containing protein n=1 Tax=Tistlia consotensis USBA 355 TaxID=560819 RepID=A0A1Y6C2L1_9PROT|nr:PAS domain-containing protein [Tistlia consotensis]SMF32596.1 PAS domain-containing protein [Tistlia consotensis USBA 355]SNR68667.1 PAS domain-containing protein [Tistlia consotensis]